MPVIVNGTNLDDDDVTNPALRGGFGVDNIIYGFLGSDHLYGGTDTIGADLLVGGEGSDLLYGGGAGGDILEGGAGNDTMFSSRGADTAVGGGGDDLYVIDAPPFFVNEEGEVEIVWISDLEIVEDMQSATGGIDTIQLRNNWFDNQVWSTYAFNTVEFLNTATPGGQIVMIPDAYKVDAAGQLLAAVEYLTVRDDVSNEWVLVDLTVGQTPMTGYLFTGTGAGETITGDIFENVIDGGAGDDTIHALGGEDFITGGDGNDIIYADDLAFTLWPLHDDEVYGGNGQDTIYGGGGSDKIYGQLSADWLWGGNGDDLVDGGGGNDTLRGEAGNDRLLGGGGADYIFGGDGNDYISGGSGSGVLYGGGDNDDIRGGADVDWLYGETGDDVLRGFDGKDELYGGTGADRLYGGSSDDILNGGIGIDQLFGEAGADIFRFDFDSLSGRDIVRDFSLGEGDKLQLFDLLEGFDPLSSSITDFVRIGDNGTHSYVSVDIDGSVGGQSFAQIARIDNILGLTDEAALYASGALAIV